MSCRQRARVSICGAHLDAFRSSRVDSRVCEEGRCAACLRRYERQVCVNGSAHRFAAFRKHLLRTRLPACRSSRTSSTAMSMLISQCNTLYVTKSMCPPDLPRPPISNSYVDDGGFKLRSRDHSRVTTTLMSARSLPCGRHRATRRSCCHSQDQSRSALLWRQDSCSMCALTYRSLKSRTAHAHAAPEAKSMASPLGQVMLPRCSTRWRHRASALVGQALGSPTRHRPLQGPGQQGPGFVDRNDAEAVNKHASAKAQGVLGFSLVCTEGESWASLWSRQIWRTSWSRIKTRPSVLAIEGRNESWMLGCDWLRCVPQVATAAFPFLMRLGCGGFVSGFRSGLPEDDGKYAVLQVAGERVGPFVEWAYMACGPPAGSKPSCCVLCQILVPQGLESRLCGESPSPSSTHLRSTSSCVRLTSRGPGYGIAQQLRNQACADRVPCTSVAEVNHRTLTMRRRVAFPANSCLCGLGHCCTLRHVGFSAD